MKIAIIGCGVMGSAFAKEFAKHHTVVLFDQFSQKAEELAERIGGKSCETMEKAIQGTDVILLAVKPKDVTTVASRAGQAFSSGQILLSILSGTSVETLSRHFPMATILRLMPNLALTCGKAVIGIVNHEDLSKEVKKTAEGLLSPMGQLFWLPEHKIEGLTALAGSGPAFVYVFIEAMIEGGIAMGLSAEESKELSLQTIEGAVALLKASGKHPGDLRWQISSPGGTTIAGLNEMEACGVRSGVIRTLLATYHRSKEFL